MFQVPSLASLNGLRIRVAASWGLGCRCSGIWHCWGCGVGQPRQLQSASNLGISICRGCIPKKKKEKKGREGKKGEEKKVTAHRKKGHSEMPHKILLLPSGQFFSQAYTQWIEISTGNKSCTVEKKKCIGEINLKKKRYWKKCLNTSVLSSAIHSSGR